MSKTWPADAVRALAALGQADFGENRAQELIGKAGELTDLPLRWHFIGQLQRNKAAAVARLGAVVHSVDRPALVGVLDRVGTETGRPVEVFVQVDLGGPEGDVLPAQPPAGERRPTTCRISPTRSPRPTGCGCAG